MSGSAPVEWMWKNLPLKWTEDVWLNWCLWSLSVIWLVSESQGELGSHVKWTVICGRRFQDLRWLFGGAILFCCSKADRKDSGTPVNISPTVPIILRARLVCTHLLQLNCRSSLQLWTQSILVSLVRNGEDWIGKMEMWRMDINCLTKMWCFNQWWTEKNVNDD